MLNPAYMYVVDILCNNKFKISKKAFSIMYMNTELVEANVAPNSILYCSLHCLVLVVYTLLSVKQILSIFKLNVYKIHRK